MNMVDLDIPQILEDIESPLLSTLIERGFVKNCTDLKALDRHILERPLSAYVGFDLTAPSLHVGSLIPLMALRHVHKAAVSLGMSKMGGAVDMTNVVLGDATTRVGDPTGKDATRPVLAAKEIEANHLGIVSCIDRVLGPARIFRNSAWLDKLTFMDFLTGPARQTSLNRLLATDVVSRRLEASNPMSLMEIIYQTMQGMDFAHLASTSGVRLQIGGSDQWTNILSGVDLAKRLHGIETFGMTLPLLVDGQGRKMGKTSGTAIWLNPKMTGPFDFWQFWRNTPDEKVGEFLALLTDLPINEVRERSAATGAAVNDSKALLASAITTLVHGKDAADESAEAAQRLHQTSSSAPVSDAGALAQMPTVDCPGDPNFYLITIADLCHAAELADSRKSAKRLIAGGGLKMDGVTVDDPDRIMEPSDFTQGPLILTAGKKRHVRILPTCKPPSIRPFQVEIRPDDDKFCVVGLWQDDEGHVIEDIIFSGLSNETAQIKKSRIRLTARIPAR